MRDEDDDNPLVERILDVPTRIRKATSKSDVADDERSSQDQESDPAELDPDHVEETSIDPPDPL